MKGDSDRIIFRFGAPRAASRVVLDNARSIPYRRVLSKCNERLALFGGVLQCRTHAVNRMNKKKINEQNLLRSCEMSYNQFYLLALSSVVSSGSWSLITCFLESLALRILFCGGGSARFTKGGENE